MSEIQKYIELPYTVILRRDDEGDFVARIDELPGCSAHGKTREEALANLDEAKVLWIEDCLVNGDSVPLPGEEVLPSGKWLQRVPRRLHRKLQVLSKREGVSFNHYVSALLAEAVGERMVLRSETSFCNPDIHTNVGVAGYFLRANFEPLPAEFRVLDTTSVGVTANSNLLESLALLSAQLPDKFEFKSRAPKDEKKKHTGFEIC